MCGGYVLKLFGLYALLLSLLFSFFCYKVSVVEVYLLFVILFFSLLRVHRELSFFPGRPFSDFRVSYTSDSIGVY